MNPEVIAEKLPVKETVIPKTQLEIIEKAFEKEPTSLVILHRGGGGIGKESCTISKAIENLFNNEVHGLEIDIRTAADGTIFVEHDGVVSKLNLDQIQNPDIGKEDIGKDRGTLEFWLDMMEFFPNKVLYLDIKDKSIDPFILMQLFFDRPALWGRVIIGAGSKLNEFPGVGKDYVHRLYAARKALELNKLVVGTNEENAIKKVDDKFFPAVHICHQIPDPVFFRGVQNLWKAFINKDALHQVENANYFNKISNIYNSIQGTGPFRNILNALRQKAGDLGLPNTFLVDEVKEFKHFFYPEDFLNEVLSFLGKAGSLAMLQKFQRSSFNIFHVFQQRRLRAFTRGATLRGHRVIAGSTDNIELNQKMILKWGVRVIMPNFPKLNSNQQEIPETILDSISNLNRYKAKFGDSRKKLVGEEIDHMEFLLNKYEQGSELTAEEQGRLLYYNYIYLAVRGEEG